MNRPIVFFWMQVSPGSWARVDVNGVPLYRSPFEGPHSRSGPLNYLLATGDNTIDIELLKVGAPDPQDERTLGAVIFQLYTVDNPGDGFVEKLDRTIIADLQYPKIWDDAKPEHQHFPLHHRQTVHLDYDLAEPIFWRAPPAEFECDGTPELRDAVRSLHGRLESKNYDGLLEDLSLKFYCDERASAGVDGQRASVKMQSWRDELLPYEPVPNEPFDMSMMHFEACRNGQVAYVTRHDEGYPLDAVCEKDPSRRIRTDLLMVQHQGRWRVFA